jgi:hypothetical protein
MGEQVAKTTTQVSDEEMAQAVISVWKRLFGTTPSKEQVYMILAQNAIETGPHRESMHNYNVGNIIVGNSNWDYFLGGDWMYADKSETTKKQLVQHFRAYPSLEVGVEDYLKLLSSKGGRYAQAWQHIMNPDVRAYSKALRAGGYYGAKEEQYTAGLLGNLSRFNKSKAYESAVSKAPSEKVSPSLLADRSSEGMEDVLEKFLQGLGLAASEEVSLKRIYKEALPNHDILIQIAAPDYTSAIEFSRVLCTALDEDLLSTSYPHTDGQLVEVECSIAGPQKECFDAVRQMTHAVAETFKEATSKVGGIVVKNNLFMNKKSSYQPISPRTAGTNYRKFLLKFV